MRLPTTALTTLLRDVRARIGREFPAGRVIVVVDGASGRAGRAFADGLAEVFDEAGVAVFRASTGDFLLPRAEREAARGSGLAARQSQAIDADAMRRVLVDPFRDGGQTSATTGFQLVAWDADRDAPALSRWVTGPADAALLIDGPLLGRPELRALWDFSIWVDTSDSASSAPEAAASLVIDGTDPARPEIRAGEGR